jgi:hypothetical protein
MSLSSPSVRVAALAFALSSWVEGLAHLRTVLLMPALPDRAEGLVHESPAAHVTSWRDRIVAWFKRSGQRDVQMDDTERTSMGVVDIAVSLSSIFLFGISSFSALISSDCFLHSSIASAAITSVSLLSLLDDVANPPLIIRVQAYQMATSHYLFSVAFASA